MGQMGKNNAILLVLKYLVLTHQLTHSKKIRRFGGETVGKRWGKEVDQWVMRWGLIKSL